MNTESGWHRERRKTVTRPTITGASDALLMSWLERAQRQAIAAPLGSERCRRADILADTLMAEAERRGLLVVGVTS